MLAAVETKMTDLALDLRSYPYSVRSHDHPHHQVILALEGALEMEIGGRCGRVDFAQGALVPAGTNHAFAGAGHNRFVILDIAAGSESGPGFSLAEGSPYFVVRRPVEHLLAFVASEGDGIGRQGSLVAPLLAASLFGDSARTGAGMPAPVTRALGFLRRAFHRPIGCEDAARAAGIGTARLHVLFKQWLGTTPGKYLADLRLADARDRLAGSAVPIADLALLAGFSEQSAFTRAFRRRFGESPAAYRRRLEFRHKIQ
jgi:AraC-like DNA-binding protein